MSKQDILHEIAAKLTALGLPVQIGTSTDLAIDHELVDASWRTGKKKIIYQALILFDEQAQTILMWEKIQETGSGFSGGFESSTSFQHGAVVLRQVKSIQYGPDGKVVEYNLNLGAIQKIVKQIASRFGWKYKMVLKKARAQYSKAPSTAGDNPQPASRPAKSVFNTLAIAAYVFLALLVIALYALMGISAVGWAIALPVLLISAAAQFTAVKKGCSTGFVLWFLTTFIVLVIFLIFYGR